MKAYQFDIEQERTRRSMPSTIRYPDRYSASVLGALRECEGGSDIQVARRLFPRLHTMLI